MLKQKLKPPYYWERQVAKYEQKAASAKNPTQRNYAQQMKRAAEKSLEASRNGVERVEADDVVDLDSTEYKEL